jgi:hypothetical protein
MIELIFNELKTQPSKKEEVKKLLKQYKTYLENRASYTTNILLFTIWLDFDTLLILLF